MPGKIIGLSVHSRSSFLVGRERMMMMVGHTDTAPAHDKRESCVRFGSRAGEAGAITHHHSTPFVDDDDDDAAAGTGP
jgi:hypothetical protein